jgi:DNA-binding GntR family transcriptional regulator
MAKVEKRLSHLPDIQDSDLRLDRSLLKDQATEALRQHISSGRIPEGTKLTEREVSRLLGISRMPAHEALITLEAEGVVISRPGGRYVIELSEKDVRDIHTLRRTLERLAAQLAAANTNAEHRAALQARLRDMEEAVAAGDAAAGTRCDMALHQTIWRQADNAHLLHILDSVLGTSFVMIERSRLRGGVSRGMVDSHRELVALIADGDADGAGQAMVAHLDSALSTSLRTLQPADGAGEP